MEPIKDGDVDVSAAARLLADPARARMLMVLADGRAQPAGELARAAGVTAATASEHLAKLVAQGWLGAERYGRHRYYRIIAPDVVPALESLAVIAPITPVRSLRGARASRAMKIARTCYDHLAGAVGVAVFDSLCDGNALDMVGGEWQATTNPHPLLTELGIEPAQFKLTGRRPPVRACLDWSQRRYHLAGGLGSLVLQRMFDEKWCTSEKPNRAVVFTPAGWAALERVADVDRAATESAAESPAPDPRSLPTARGA
ncbi:ArsR/SmtB family transcription factor [Nocardia sp. NPDC088792]|uniref:ArsR/SmtB family transcription factor n=1 Tax=Nocardia sp. NPDC088792 TaxID=3364332 RepID=UPI0037FEE76D